MNPANIELSKKKVQQLRKEMLSELEPLNQQLFEVMINAEITRITEDIDTKTLIFGYSKETQKAIDYINFEISRITNKYLQIKGTY